MKTKDKKGVPKGRVMWFASKSDDLVSSLVLQPNRYGPSLDTPVAVLPCRTPTQAKHLVANWNAGEEDILIRAVNAYYEGSGSPCTFIGMRAVLRELGYLGREGR